MNFIKITVFDDKANPTFFRDEPLREERTYNIDLSFVYSYKKFCDKHRLYQILFSLHNGNIHEWNYISESARNEAFDKLELNIYKE